MAGTPTLLLVERRSEHPRRLSADLLKDDGYRVLEAEDGKAAIRILREHCPPPDSLCLVILDMMLPEASGLDVLRELAKLGNYTPVVAMSADYQQLRRATDAGLMTRCRKPFNLDELMDSRRAELLQLAVTLSSSRATRRDDFYADGQHRTDLATALGLSLFWWS